ncbi:trifunctional serine/threonine-protein kinase/ATP-binding protein/sensor histidine kinase [Dapis sp. BLCC M126]|uniref:trifunctional serine/threonine-protein kinase/ATP-binding protein/sensor histidine kinase n=1 Tax=Dapis sp. BLCC M126 TaxID=3400189 RepID=UPI003CF0860C
MGLEKITASTEKKSLASLNFQAGNQAKLATAYMAALNYFELGIKLLPKDCWEQNYSLSLKLHESAVEAAYLTGQVEQMNTFIKIIKEEAKCYFDTVNTLQTQIQFYGAQQDFISAIDIARNLLQEFDIFLPSSPNFEDVKQEFSQIKAFVHQLDLNKIANLPELNDPQKLAVANTLMTIGASAIIADTNLFWFITFELVKISLQHGNSPYSAYGYVSYGILVNLLEQDIDEFYRLGQLSLEILHRFESNVIKSKVLEVVGAYTTHIKFHVKETLPFLSEAHISGLESGDFEFAGYSVFVKCQHLYFVGQTLTELQSEIIKSNQVINSIHQKAALNWNQIFAQAVDKLLGQLHTPSHLTSNSFNTNEIAQFFLESNDGFGLHFLYFHQAILKYLFSSSNQALEFSKLAEKYLDAPRGFLTEYVFHFYDSLIYLSCISQSADLEDSMIAKYLAKVEENQHKMKIWASHAPMNFQHKYDLVEAEKCRVLEHKLEAIEMYDKAIARAKENEYIQEEALANELAAKFYLNWDKEKIAAIYMQEAYYGYVRWGAKAKTEDLEKRYPHLLAPILKRQKVTLTSSATLTSLTQGTISPTATGAGEVLDLATLMKASRTLSEDISLDGAISNLMEVVRENAGAETVALMLFTDQELILTALATGQETPTLTPIPVTTSQAVPLSIINQVKRSQKPLVLDNASNNNACAGDAYIQKHQPQSVLCLPLIDRAKLIGVLYLENNQITGAFTRERVEVLSLLCSQAAISLENARLYGESQNYAQQLEQTQLQLVQNEKMASIGQLVSGVAHEINNPVGFIGGNLDYATGYIQDLMDLLDLYQQGFEHNSQKIQHKIEEIELDYLREDLPDLIKSMKEGTKRIAEISKSMGTFSRADTIAKVPFNIHDGIDSTLLILRHRLKANELRPEIQVIKNYGDLPEINCYPGQLNQVFMNLIANAIDALEESNSGKTFEEIKSAPNQIIITTEIEDEKQQAIIHIADNGMGISEEVKQKIFENLFTTKGVGKGTGLGLSISRQIVVEKHGGKITCTSELGTGTEFAISLPNN